MWKLGALAVLFAVTQAGPEPVRATSLDERNPAAGPDVVAWSQNSRARPERHDAYVKVGSAPAVKVNARGTEGWIGGIDGTRLVYQEVSPGGQSDLKLFDISTKKRSALPAGFNTERWDWHPSISGDWILYGRGQVMLAGPQYVILRSLATGEQRVLDSIRRANSVLHPGQVNGNFAVWVKCPSRHVCNVFRYDIAAGTKTQIPNPSGGPQYAASVTPTGTVYFVRSGKGCGIRVQLMRIGLVGPATRLLSLSAGQDVLFTYSFSESPTLTHVFYDRGSCRTNRWDILKIVDSTPAP